MSAASDEILSGAEVKVPGHLQAAVVAQEPVLGGATVAVVHPGTVGAVLQAADAQAHLGDHVQEGVLLRAEPSRASGAEGQTGFSVRIGHIKVSQNPQGWIPVKCLDTPSELRVFS